MTTRGYRYLRLIDYRYSRLIDRYLRFIDYRYLRRIDRYLRLIGFCIIQLWKRCTILAIPSARGTVVDDPGLQVL